MRSRLESRYATYVSASLSEMRIAETLSGKIVDRHVGSIPDVLFELSGKPAFCEVKTVSAGGNWLVLKGDQIRSFQGIDRCFFALTEHNMAGIRKRLSTPAGRKEVYSDFALVNSVMLSSDFVRRFYDWIPFAEQTIQTRGVTYKRCRLSHLQRFVSESGEPSATVPGSRTVLVGTARSLSEILEK